MLGVSAIAMTIVCIIWMVYVYGYGRINSISQTATTGNQIGFVLPIKCGMVVLFALTYVGYTWPERVVVYAIAVGMLLLSMHPCSSRFVTEELVGLLKVTPELSAKIHNTGAVLAFSAMTVWVGVFFTKRDKSAEITPEKYRRNIIYFACAGIMAVCCVFIGIGSFIKFGPYYVLIFEAAILIALGCACIVKSGIILGDKK